MIKSAVIAVATLAAIGLGVASASAQGDADAGEAVFKKCKACHTSEAGGKNKVGPALFAVVGRQAGTAPGFKYSPSYVDAGEGGLTWSVDTIFEYLLDPKAFMREVTGDKRAKSRMVFKLKKEDDRRDVISFLETLQ